MTQLQRLLVLSGFLSVWDQGEGGGGGGGRRDNHHHLHHHHYYHHDMQTLPPDSYLLEELRKRGEREKNLVTPPLPPPPPPPPPSPLHMKKHTWSYLEEEGGGGGGGLTEEELRKMEEEERHTWRRMKSRRRKLKRMIKEEVKRRKRQMRLTTTKRKRKRKRKGGGEGRPNIVVIVADDLGYNDVPWHNPDIRAPELLRLARRGVVLQNHYVLPVCSPSRAALLTGAYPFRYGRQTSFTPLSPTGLNTSLTLLPQHLQRLGYKTHLVGKWHLGHCSWAYTPTHRGFHSFYGYYLGSQGYYNRYKRVVMPPAATTTTTTTTTTLEEAGNGGGGGEGLLWGVRGAPPEWVEHPDGGYDFRLNEAPLDNVTGVYSNDLYAARVEEVIRSHVRGGGGAPLFLLLSLQATHGPLEVPPAGCGRRGAAPRHVQNPARRIFQGMVTALDCVVGRVVKQLRRSRLYHNTLIVFTSDNGGNFRVGGNNFPLRGSKGSVFEGGTRGVSLLHSPLLPHVGHRYRGLMHVVDWRATLLHAAKGPAHWPTKEEEEGGKRKEEEEGKEEEEEEGGGGGDDDSVDMWGALLLNTPSPRTSFVYNLRKGPLRGAIRRRHWKLVVGSGGRYDGWVPPEDVGGLAGMGGLSWNTPANRLLHAHAHAKDTSEEVLLFNMRDDPLETTDLSGLYPEVVASLRAKLRLYGRHSKHPHCPRDDPQGHPRLHGGFFSPGWCDPVV